MAQNTLPSGIHDLMQLAEDMAHGLEIHGPWLKTTQTKPAEFRAAFDDVRQNEAAFATTRRASTYPTSPAS